MNESASTQAVPPEEPKLTIEKMKISFPGETGKYRVSIVCLDDRAVMIPRQVVDIGAIDGFITINTLHLTQNSNDAIFFEAGDYKVTVKLIEIAGKKVTSKQITEIFSLNESQASKWSSNMLNHRINHKAQVITRALKQISKIEQRLALQAAKPALPDREARLLTNGSSAKASHQTTKPVKSITRFMGMVKKVVGIS